MPCKAKGMWTLHHHTYVFVVYPIPKLQKINMNTCRTPVQTPPLLHIYIYKYCNEGGVCAGAPACIVPSLPGEHLSQCLAKCSCVASAILFSVHVYSSVSAKPRLPVLSHQLEAELDLGFLG